MENVLPLRTNSGASRRASREDTMVGAFFRQPCRYINVDEGDI